LPTEFPSAKNQESETKEAIMAEKKANLTDKQGHKQPDKKHLKIGNKPIKGEKRNSAAVNAYLRIDGLSSK
jgi:hypothetical protein